MAMLSTRRGHQVGTAKCSGACRAGSAGGWPQCHEPPIFLGMVTIPPIKMVMIGGWLIILFNLHYLRLIKDIKRYRLYSWLVVWNIFFPYIEKNNPN